VLSTSFRKFLGDESGGYTIWSLIWFSLYVAIGGLAVDMTDAYRNQTMLQSTADASALAAVMSLPDQVDGLAQALVYAADNMNPAINGTVLRGSEVIFGNWNFSARTFTPSTTSPNAVWVITRRDDANNNPVATNFLRILGLWGLPMDRWNISVEAIAARFLPFCLLENAFIAGNRIDFTSNNILNNVCIHAQNLIEDPAHNYAVEIQNGGTIMDTVQISMPDTDDMIDRPTVCSNEGLCEEGVVVYGDMMPTDAFLAGETITGMLDETATDTLSDDMYSADDVTLELVPPDYVHIDLNNCETWACTTIVAPDGSLTYEYNAVMEKGTVYVIDCNSPMEVFTLPSPEVQPILEQVAIISECRIEGQTNMRLEGVLLASSAVGGGKKPWNKATIHFPAGTQFGRQDNCAPGGGVQIYSAASVQFAPSGAIMGMQIVARGNVELTANETVDGLTIQAGRNIKLTANAAIGTKCPSEEGAFVWRYRLVL
jgi:hypothetical protein